MSVQILQGDCRDVLAAWDGELFDSVVCDPPYHLTSIVKRFGAENAAAVKVPETGTGAYARASKGFMGKQWDGGDVAFQPDTWRAVYDVLKPGAHLIAFSGTRTYHRMACAIEDAGFEIRDQLGWLYGSGFPKSHNVGKAIDKMAGAEREVVGSYAVTREFKGRQYVGDPSHAATVDITAPATAAARQWEGWGTALKPAWEPIVLARKPLIGTVAANVLAHGTGALNIDGCRVDASDADIAAAAVPERDNLRMFSGDGRGRTNTTFDMSAGRWPANIIHDGSEEVLAGFPDVGSSPPVGSMGGGSPSHAIYGDFAGERHENGYGDSGSAARFFYCAKADAGDRQGSKHPTVKPVDLMAYLVRLVTPPGGTVLDCFAGTGSTGIAAMREGFNAVLIEREDEYVADIKRRIGHVSGGDTPLFAEAMDV
jgi:DNA modification methylase